MKNNKLTLKALKAELDLIKSNKTNFNKLEGRATNLNIKLRENSMFLLYLISGVLAYAHKIPFIGKIISLLGIWYGKTTIWKILIKIRKVFIIFNAILGVLMVYKTIGFSTDNLLAGFSAMGYTYLEIFASMTKRLFNWFLELFDHKIIPNVPGNNSVNNSWWSKSMKQDMSFLNQLKDLPSVEPLNKLPGSLRNEYADQVSWFKDINVKIDPTPWYKDWYTLLWWSATVVGILGVVYVGYHFVIDPYFNLGSPTIKGNSPIDSLGNSPIDPGSGGNPIDPGQDTGTKIINFVSGIGSGISTIRTKLNPFNWLMATQSADTNVQFVDFMERQGRLVTQDKRYYPFTEINPYDSWFDRLRISWLGETNYELTNRLKERAFALREMNVLDIKLPDSPITELGALTPIQGFTPGFNTPRIGNVGLGVKSVSGSGLLEIIESSTSYSDIFNKLSSLPQTPTVTPTTLPVLNPNDVVSVNPSWTDHAVDSNELTKYIENKGKAVEVSTKIVEETIKEHNSPLEISKNKISILELD
jgi:hypothetical protein